MDVSALLDMVAATPTEAARKLGVSDGHIHDLRTGRRRLTMSLAAKIEAATGRTDLVGAVAAADAADARSKAEAKARQRSAAA